MTQERKDQLYDQMISWICEHHGDDELFQILCGQFGMTREELHDHCIESLDERFTAVGPITELKQRVRANFQSYREKWLRMQPSELIYNCEELEAVTRMAEELPVCVNAEEARFLLRFQNPLEVVSDEFTSKTGSNIR